MELTQLSEQQSKALLMVGDDYQLVVHGQLSEAAAAASGTLEGCQEGCQTEW